MLATAAYYLQRYGLSAAFLYMAWTRVSPLLRPGSWAPVGAALGGRATAQSILYLQQLTQSVMLIAFNVLVGLLLLATKKPNRPPERLVHVIVPLVATFSYLAYGFAHWLPQRLHEIQLLPSPGLLRIGFAGLLITAAYVLSFTALLYLRRSFAVFVEVRRGVMRGPYRWVRHPMYLGYVLVLTALFLTRPTAAFALLSAMMLGVTIVRARLEEQMLAVHVPGYAQHMKRTGMLFPRLRRRSA